MASDAEILDAARTRLHEILTAGVEEFGQGGERARMIAVKDLKDLIADYERKTENAAGNRNVLRPIETINA